ncbi:phosphotransferase family protein [Streptomyces sp. DSM 44917]|uniref:Phosphotransferase family protein n=1 Tax=Streptomyces boetiae TaxID=3075541 RepID=A0ABU2LA43_9ACTN|nr:phosphotransferase family protein [Streptomyces sp. DSM 44917]MDT0308351.1 phosphotransferase family protein [Streptomyces sp. DSM 44917]
MTTISPAPRATRPSGRPGTRAGRPAGLHLPRLQRYFKANVPHCQGPLRAEPLPGGRSHLAYAVTDGHSQWVVRRPPLIGPAPLASDLAREFRVLRALWDRGVALPRPVAFCAEPDVLGAPFLVTSRVEGLVLRSRQDVRGLTPQRLTRCADGLLDQLTRLHAVSYQEAGLAGLGRPEGYLRRQVEGWRAMWERVATRELPSLPRLYRALAERVPPDAEAAVVHGGFRLDRAILDPEDLGRVRAVVGWGLAAIGDPLADLGVFLAYRDAAVNGLLDEPAGTDPKFPGTLELAEQYALLTGRSLTRLPFHLGLAFFKIAVIAEGVQVRAERTASPEAAGEAERPCRAGESVPALVAAGLAALVGGR